MKSRTGFVITVSDCPVLWQSKLQTETALSTMEAEIVALAHSCRELFPIMDMVQVLGTAVGLPLEEPTSMHVSIHKDNAEFVARPFHLSSLHEASTMQSRLSGFVKTLLQGRLR